MMLQQERGVETGRNCKKLEAWSEPVGDSSAEIAATREKLKTTETISGVGTEATSGDGSCDSCQYCSGDTTAAWILSRR